MLNVNKILLHIFAFTTFSDIVHIYALNGRLKILYGCVGLLCNDALIDYLMRIEESIEDPDSFSYSGGTSFLGILPTYATLRNCDNFVSGLLTNTPTVTPLPNGTSVPTSAPVPFIPHVGTCEVKCTPFAILRDLGRFECKATEGNLDFFEELAKAADSEQTRRRSLEVVDTHKLMVEHGDDCSDMDYDMYLVMEGVHMAGLAVPVDDEEKSNCPNMIFHSQLSGERELTKVAMKAKPETVNDVRADDKFYVGRRSLDVVINAFHSADVSVGEGSTGMYNVITNNCAGMLRNMAGHLDIPVDQNLIGFVTNRLLSQKGNNMIKLMSQSSGMSALWNDENRHLKEDLNPEELIEKRHQNYEDIRRIKVTYLQKGSISQTTSATKITKIYGDSQLHILKINE